ncbi:MAG TPA: hypothetical protein VJ976_07230 [Ornithinimicrobium sp.]|uniref:hypothetical protein n=1 Tax=Ornithinimicrobium sp. TaxID=1977084 RepID=UPI002B460B01|nr:hypothetical protein [Ornithinimicrobium sp.]HKJ12168.1 hypothetical protein [Ornithinimicrobium sp.]
MHPTHLPLRLATGAFILNSGITKLGADEETAAGIHGMASTAYPMFKEIKPKDFTELLAYGEIALGTALLLPTVPSAAAGTAVAGFGTALLGMYWQVPGMRMENSIRPTPDGLLLAKDTWLVAAGVTLTLQSALGAAKSAAKSATGSAKGLASDISSSTKDALSFG